MKDSTRDFKYKRIYQDRDKLLPPAKSDAPAQPVGGLSACGHTFKILTPDATGGKETLILKRLAVCGVDGFALHWDERGFRVSHIETGALASEGYATTVVGAISSAETRLSTSAKHRKVTPAQEMERVIGIVKKACKSANAPAPPAEAPAGGKP